MKQQAFKGDNNINHILYLYVCFVGYINNNFYCCLCFVCSTSALSSGADNSKGISNIYFFLILFLSFFVAALLAKQETVE